MSTRKAHRTPNPSFHKKLKQLAKDKVLAKVDPTPTEPPSPKKENIPASSKPNSIKVRTFGEFSSIELEPRKWLTTNLLPAAEVTVVLSPADMAMTPSILLMSYCVVGGKHLPPFDRGVDVPALLCISGSDVQQDMDLSNMISERDPSDKRRAQVAANLSVFHRGLEPDQPMSILSKEGRRAIDDRAAENCGLIVIDDYSAWTDCIKLEDADIENLKDWCDELNSRGIAVLIFDREAKNGRDARMLVRHNSNLIRFTSDPAAPQDLGGGFNIVRKKSDFKDTIPSKVQFWYKIIDGKFDFGWAYRNQAGSIKTAKKVEIAVRNRQIAALRKAKKSQKEIAFALKVHQSTISRYLDGIKGAGTGT